MNETAHSRSPEGVLYVVATPIGNREDITLRAINVLKNVELIAAEDTRHTGRLLEHLGIRTRMVSYHKFNERQRTPQLIETLLSGRPVALVSSAGTPGISDPGAILVREASTRGIRVCPIPGPSAVVAGLSASGLESDGFIFLGFPPKKKGRRDALLESLALEPRILVWYEAPQRILSFIGEIVAVLGDRQAVLCRELTKRHEEIIRGPLTEVAEALRNKREIRGEVTLLVAGGAPPDKAAALDAALAEVHRRLQQADAGTDTNRIAKAVAREYGLPKAIVYEAVLKAKGKR